MRSMKVNTNDESFRNLNTCCYRNVHFLLLAFRLARLDIVMYCVCVVNQISFIIHIWVNDITVVIDVVNSCTHGKHDQTFVFALNKVVNVLQQLPVSIMAFAFYLN